ncbi:MAG: amidohydrolase [bacterium]
MTVPEFADRIFLRGSILTMADGDRVEAVAIGGGRILAAGTERDVLEMRGPGTVVTELGESALLPGFIDGHGHLAKVAANLGQANLAGPPVGGVTDIESLLSELRRFAAEREKQPGEWIVGRGYDNAFLKEGRHPTRTDLDQVSQDHPIYVGHVSGHLSAANSLALAIAGVSADTDDPPGGVIRRLAGSREPDGVLEEAAMGFFNAIIPQPDAAAEHAQLAEAQRIYASFGLTTAQEGAMFPAEQAMFENAARDGRLYLDVVGYAFWATARPMLADRRTGVYDRRFKLGGMKLMLDGSPQGKTAWLTRPYEVVPEGQPPDYCGYPAMPDEQALGLTETAFREGWQVIAHCNGDAAAEQYLRAIDAAAEAHPKLDRRPVMIHAQTVREDQLDRMVGLGILPSFFASHVFYWGDYHRDSVLGAERASRISPMRSAARRGMRFNLHNDAPVVPPDVMRLVWSAVERKTRSGQVLGGDQALTVMEALRAVTIDAAYAYFEEDQKGSIEVGKLADLIVLEADPTRVAPSELAGIRVRETLKEGTTIFGRG